MKTFKGYGNFWKIYGMSELQLWLLELGLRLIILTRPLRSVPRQAAHWLYKRPPRYERRLFLVIVAIILALSNKTTIIFNAIIGGVLSFSFILYVLFRSFAYNNNIEP